MPEPCDYDPNNPNSLFSQILTRLDSLDSRWNKQNGNISNLAEQVSLLNNKITGLPCQKERDRLEYLEKWKLELEQRERTRLEKKSYFRSRLAVALIGAVCGGSIAVVVNIITKVGRKVFGG